jgi:cobalt-zinc-cadmium efflux system outer membrane protein
MLPTFMQESSPASAINAPDGAPPILDPKVKPPLVSASSSTGIRLLHESHFAELRPERNPVGAAKESEQEDKSRPLEESPSPKKAGPLVLTLDQAVLQCLQTDPKLRAALEPMTQAQADLWTSSILPNPLLTGDGLFLPLRRITPDKPGGPPQTDWMIGYPIDWYLFGKRAAAIESARLGVDVSAADYADQVRMRIANVVAAFYDFLEARALSDLAKQDLEALRRVEAMTAERVKLGGVGTVELDRARLAVYDAQREARSREVALSAARSKFRAFLGPAGIDPALEVVGSLDVSKPVAGLPAEEALRLAEQVRPDIISLRRQIAKAEAAVQAEKTKGCPSLTPTFELTEQFQHSLGLPNMPTWDVSVTLSLPLFDRNQGNIAKARSTQAQAAFMLRSQLNDLRAEIEQAADAFRAAYANVKANAPEQLRVARDVRDKIEQAYKVGGKTLLELLDAERAYRDTRRTYILGQSSYWHSLHKLNAAIGKQVLP